MAGEITQAMFVDALAMAATTGAKFVTDTLNHLCLELSMSHPDDESYEQAAHLIGELRSQLEKGFPMLDTEMRRTAPALYKMLKEIS